jgi:hypothetical protein
VFEGTWLGVVEGIKLGALDDVGTPDGAIELVGAALPVGNELGWLLGSVEGTRLIVGTTLGTALGLVDGTELGIIEGTEVGMVEGTELGIELGITEGT